MNILELFLESNYTLIIYSLIFLGMGLFAVALGYAMDKKEIENVSWCGKEVISINIANEKEEVARFIVSVSVNN
jgi:hypothetical protein